MIKHSGGMGYGLELKGMMRVAMTDVGRVLGVSTEWDNIGNLGLVEIWYLFE